MRKPRSHNPSSKSNILTQGKKQIQESNPIPPYYPLPPHQWTTPNGTPATLLDLYMEETAKIPDEEAVNNQDQDGDDLPKHILQLQAGSVTEACLADGYIHTVVGRVVSEGSESGSTTQQYMQTVVVVEPRLPKSGSPSTNHNFISKLINLLLPEKLLRLRRTVW